MAEEPPSTTGPPDYQRGSSTLTTTRHYLFHGPCPAGRTAPTACGSGSIIVQEWRATHKLPYWFGVITPDKLASLLATTPSPQPAPQLAGIIGHNIEPDYDPLAPPAAPPNLLDQCQGSLTAQRKGNMRLKPLAFTTPMTNWARPTTLPPTTKSPNTKRCDPQTTGQRSRIILVRRSTPQCLGAADQSRRPGRGPIGLLPVHH